MSKPIKNQNNILFLKLDDKRSPQIETSNIENLKENLKNQKKMNYLLCTLVVIYHRLKIII